MEHKTVKGGTITKNGLIPHLEFMGISLPVVVTKQEDRIYPVHDLNGSYRYALPGGGRISVTQGDSHG